MNQYTPQTRDLLFCFRETDLSEAIQAFTQSPFSHVAMIKIENGIVMVYDAQTNGFKPKTWDEWVKKYGYKYVVMRDPNTTESKLTTYSIRLDEMNGKKYDHFSLAIRKPFNIGRDIANVVRRKDKPEWKAEDPLARIYCSEAGAYATERAIIDLTPQELFNDVTIDSWRFEFKNY